MDRENESWIGNLAKGPLRLWRAFGNVQTVVLAAAVGAAVWFYDSGHAGFVRRLNDALLVVACLCFLAGLGRWAAVHWFGADADDPIPPPANDAAGEDEKR